MGSYDGAEVCKLVGLFILHKLSEKFGKKNVSLYRNDGLMFLKGPGKRSADRARKSSHHLSPIWFKDHSRSQQSNRQLPWRNF